MDTSGPVASEVVVANVVDVADGDGTVEGGTVVSAELFVGVALVEAVTGAGVVEGEPEPSPPQAANTNPTTTNDD